MTFFYCADSSEIHTYTGRHVYYNDSYIWVSDIQPGFFLHCDWSFSLSVRLKKGEGGFLHKFGFILDNAANLNF